MSLGVRRLGNVGSFYISGQMWKNCDVHPFLLLPTVLYLRLLFRKLFMVGPYLLSLLDAGIAIESRGGA